MDEYSNEFQLAYFAQEIFPTEASRALKFERELKHDIGSRMFGKEWTNMKKTYEIPLRHKQTIAKERK